MEIDARDLLKILRACKENNVAKVKIGNVEIEMKAGDAVSSEPKVNEITRKPTPEEIEEAAKDANIRENLEAIEPVEDFLHISDPSSFERLLIEKELEPSETAQH